MHRVTSFRIKATTVCTSTQPLERVDELVEVGQVAETLVDPREQRLAARANDGAAAKLREAAVVNRLERLPVCELDAY